MKDAYSIDAVRHSRAYARSRQLIRGLKNNLVRRRFQRLLIGEIGLKQMSMSRPASGRHSLLFRGRISADTHPDLEIKTSPSVPIADYFRSSKFQPARMASWLSFIGQPG